MIPKFHAFIQPVLKHVGSADVVSTNDLIDPIADEFDLKPEERAEFLPSGAKTRVADRIGWAMTYLKQAALIQKIRRGHFSITERGRKTLQSGAHVDLKYLEKFQEFRDFKTRKKAKNDSDVSQSELSNEESATPHEALLLAYAGINESLSSEILERVRSSEPSFLERLIVKLFKAMNYGGAMEDSGRVLGGSGDGGVDGVIDQDALGVDQIYLQAKRYSTTPVGPADIQAFFGALDQKRVSKGIFVTTSEFTSGARKAAKDLSARIILIDGEELARLMIKYNIGCREEETVVLKKIDEDFFEETE